MANNESVLFSTNAALLSSILFIGMVLLLELGSTVGHRLRKTEDNENNSINTTIVAAVLGLFAFLLGFTFSMSGGRFENRRINNINEANAIGTAILRADFYTKPERDSFRRDFKVYTLARINYFKAGSDLMAIKKAELDAQYYANRIWNRASSNATTATSLFPGNLMIPALNSMIDSANYNNYEEKFRVPDLIILLLFSISLVSAFFVGYYSIRKGGFNRTITVGFCLLSTLVIYTTLDLDRSRSGLIRLNTSQKSITDLITLFDQP
jgi:hypothetical protein